MVTEVTTLNQLQTSGIQAPSTHFAVESLATSPDTLLPTTSSNTLLSTSSSKLSQVLTRSSSSPSLAASPVSPLVSFAASSTLASASLAESSKTFASLAPSLVPTPASLATSPTSESASFAPSSVIRSASFAVVSRTSSESFIMASKSQLLSSSSPASMSVSLVTVCPKSSSESLTVTAAPASLRPTLSSLPPQSSVPLTLLPQNQTKTSSITASSFFHLKMVSSSVSQSSLNSSNSSVLNQNDCVIYQYYNITKELKPKRIKTLKQCLGRRRCNFNVTRQRLGEPYKDKIMSLRLFIKSSCQPGKHA